MTTQEKANATKQAIAAQYAAQTIVIDDQWRIVRSDFYNWEIQHKGRFFGYYGRLTDAFRALPKKMVSEAAAGTLQEILALERATCQLVEKALLRHAKT